MSQAEIKVVKVSATVQRSLGPNRQLRSFQILELVAQVSPSYSHEFVKPH